MNWGKWIVVAFISFAAFIVTLVTVCMRQDISLVSENYYKDELVYQEQIARERNANQLTQKPLIRESGNFLEVSFQEFDRIESGSLSLFRPSDPTLDKTFMLKSNVAGKQSFPLSGIEKGMYRARMQWTMGGKEYFVETVVNI